LIYHTFIRDSGLYSETTTKSIDAVSDKNQLIYELNELTMSD